MSFSPDNQHFIVEQKEKSEILEQFPYSQAPRQECVSENYFLISQRKTCVLGAQKNRLNETVLLSDQNMFKLMDKKIITILR